MSTPKALATKQGLTPEEREERRKEIDRLIKQKKVGAALALDREQATLAALRAIEPPARAFIRKSSRSEVDADDVYAELAVRVTKYLPDFRGEASLVSWAFRIARSILFEARARGGPAGACVTGVSDLAASSGTVLTTTDHLQRAWFRERLKTLSEEERRILQLRSQDRSWEEIAKEMHKEQPALRQVYSRLLERLRGSAPVAAEPAEPR